jgi:hypothetical protein
MKKRQDQEGKIVRQDGGWVPLHNAALCGAAHLARGSAGIGAVLLVLGLTHRAC